MATIRVGSSHIVGGSPSIPDFDLNLLGIDQGMKNTECNLAVSEQDATTGLDRQETGSGNQHTSALMSAPFLVGNM